MFCFQYYSMILADIFLFSTIIISFLTNWHDSFIIPLIVSFFLFFFKSAEKSCLLLTLRNSTSSYLIEINFHLGDRACFIPNAVFVDENEVYNLQSTKRQHHRDQYHGPSERFPKCPWFSTRGTGCLRSLRTPDITPIIPTQQSVNWGKHAALERHSCKQRGISSDGSYATQDGRREQRRALTGEEKAWTKKLINCVRTGQVYSQCKAGAGVLANWVWYAH